MRLSDCRGDSDHDGQKTTYPATDGDDDATAGLVSTVVVMARRGASGTGPGSRNIRIEGEPDLATGTLEEWERYREALAALPQDDEAVRLAIAVADARIATLRRSTRSNGPDDRGRR